MSTNYVVNSTMSIEMQRVSQSRHSLRCPQAVFHRIPTGHKADLFMAVELPWSPGAEWPTGHVAFTGVDVKGMKIPLPKDLVQSTQGTRVLVKGMPKRQGDKVTGYGDLIIRYEYLCPTKP